MSILPTNPQRLVTLDASISVSSITTWIAPSLTPQQDASIDIDTISTHQYFQLSVTVSITTTSSTHEIELYPSVDASISRSISTSILSVRVSEKPSIIPSLYTHFTYEYTKPISITPSPESHAIELFYGLTPTIQRSLTTVIRSASASQDLSVTPSLSTAINGKQFYILASLDLAVSTVKFLEPSLSASITDSTSTQMQYLQTSLKSEITLSPFSYELELFPSIRTPISQTSVTQIYPGKPVDLNVQIMQLYRLTEQFSLDLGHLNAQLTLYTDTVQSTAVQSLSITQHSSIELLVNSLMSMKQLPSQIIGITANARTIHANPWLIIRRRS